MAEIGAGLVIYQGSDEDTESEEIRYNNDLGNCLGDHNIGREVEDVVDRDGGSHRDTNNYGNANSNVDTKSPEYNNHHRDAAIHGDRTSPGGDVIHRDTAIYEDAAIYRDTASHRDKYSPEDANSHLDTASYGDSTRYGDVKIQRNTISHGDTVNKISKFGFGNNVGTLDASCPKYINDHRNIGKHRNTICEVDSKEHGYITNHRDTVGEAVENMVNTAVRHEVAFDNYEDMWNYNNSEKEFGMKANMKILDDTKNDIILEAVSPHSDSNTSTSSNSSDSSLLPSMSLSYHHYSSPACIHIRKAMSCPSLFMRDPEPPSLLQMKFPHLKLPSSHPPYLLDPVSQFQPRPDLLVSLQELGLSLNGATKALFWTGNFSLEEAADWCFSCPGRDMDTSLEMEVNMWRADLECREETAVVELEKTKRMYEEREGLQTQVRILNDSGIFCTRDDFENCQEDEEEDENIEEWEVEGETCFHAVLIINSEVSKKMGTYIIFDLQNTLHTILYPLICG